MAEFKTFRSQVTGLPANPKYTELPCGCRVINPEIHVVKNEYLNIILAQCLECKKIIDISPAKVLEIQ